jgi:hypothetical protein
MIISVSRRTDIPAYYSEWFINRIKEGYVLTRNPMNHSQVSKVKLTSDVVDCFVFWTKDPYNFMDKLDYLDNRGYTYYFQFTLTPYSNDVERNLRSKNEIIETFQKLSNKIGKKNVLWRYDPIIINENLTLEYHKAQFEILCSKLNGYTSVCTISFVDIYGKLNKVVKDKLIRELNEDEIKRLAISFSEIGKKYGIEIRSCSEKIDLSTYGINPSSCIDKVVIEDICNCKLDIKKDAGQRPGCGCFQSIDIGVYNTCKNGCVYCYANYSESAVENNCLKHIPTSDILIGTVGEDEIIIERKMFSNKNIYYQESFQNL